MLGLLVALPFALIATAAPQAVREASSGSVKTALAPLFARANTDPAGLVPLLCEGSRALGSLTGTEARLLGDTLEPYCRRAFFGAERVPAMEEIGLALYTVRAGDVPERIVRRYKTGAGILSYLNEGYDERRLREGQTLKVLDLSTASGAHLEIAVDKALYRLAAWRIDAEGRRSLVTYVPVGLGAAASPTPSGRTSITLRARNPEWTDPVTKTVFAAGDPRNVLGGYWIALDAAGLGKSGIGLHGFTGDVPANWIEQPASQGCVRMLSGDIDRLFYLALEGTSVSIGP
ncbi:MAG: L,D-transpeptidase family protein [Planctomycetota bacterium]